MVNQKYFYNFIKKGKFEFESINRLKSVLCMKDKELIKNTFEFVDSLVSVYDKDNNNLDMINNCVTLLFTLCNGANFNNDEVLLYRMMIKSIRVKLLSKYNEFRIKGLLHAANKLDEIVLDKKLATKDLRILIKNLVDKKEDVNIIKKLLNTNKGVLLADNNELFDYTFDKAMTSLSECTEDIFYYIVLLKIFYNSKIDKTACLKKLNAACDEKNEFGNEIYQIIHGNKRFLTSDQVLDKYFVLQELSNINIISPTNRTIDDFILSIDDEKANLRDDAFSIYKDGDLYHFVIYITDPTSYIEHNGVIDLQARNNLSSIYLPGSDFKMLSPSMLSSLSLDKNQNRKVLGLHIVMNSNGMIKEYDLKEEVIKVNENLSFSDADRLLMKNKGNLSNKIELLYEVALILKKSNPKKYVYWKKKENDSIDKVVLVHKSQKIVNELMVLYNYFLAVMAIYNDFPFVFRTNSPSYIEDLVKNLDIKIDGDVKNVLNSIYLKSTYSTLPGFHYGLNLPYYSHSTSPLRRYPDLYNLYLLHAFYFNDLNGVFREDFHKTIVDYFNKRSIQLALMSSEYSRSLKKTI